MKKSKIKIFLIAALIIAVMAVPVFADVADGFLKQLSDRVTMMADIIQIYYYKDVKAEDLINGAVKGMFGALDKHSMYFTADEFKEFTTDVSGDFGGLGMYIEIKDNKITVISPIEDTPAYRAGIKTGDQIIFIDGVNVTGWTTEKAATLMKGQPGTKVKLGILRQGAKEIIYIDLTRETIKINPVKYEIRPDNIGYIRITEFNSHSYENMIKAVNAMKAKNVKGVVIDLRDNPGGILDEVVRICRMLIPKGPILHIEYKDKSLETYSSDLAKAPFKVALLTNGGSASASEIMAAAIKESGTGKLIGERTYGKGTVQSIFKLSDGTGFKITIARYLTPKKFALDGIGIMPDIEVKSSTAAANAELSPIKGDRNMVRNMVGLDVLGMQQRLNRMGYPKVNEDGVFTEATQKAVMQFQKDNKLKVDGAMDAADVKVLQEKFQEAMSKVDPQLDRAIQQVKAMIK